MAVLRGAGGAVLVGTDVVAEVESWTMDHVLELADTTALGDKDRTFDTYTLRNTTGSMSVKFNSTDTAQIAINAQIVSGATPAVVTLVLLTNNTVGSKAGYTGSAWLTGLGITTGVDSAIMENVSFQYSGGVTAYTT